MFLEFSLFRSFGAFFEGPRDSSYLQTLEFLFLGFQVVAPGPVLASWLGDPEGNPLTGAGAVQQPPLGPQGTAGAKAATAQARHRGGVVRLFSMNDYLGLSTHPAVCRAVSEAALAMGSGGVTWAHVSCKHMGSGSVSEAALSMGSCRLSEFGKPSWDQRCCQRLPSPWAQVGCQHVRSCEVPSPWAQVGSR
jgi:hypothetical protein